VAWLVIGDRKHDVEPLTRLSDAPSDGTPPIEVRSIVSICECKSVSERVCTDPSPILYPISPSCSKISMRLASNHPISMSHHRLRALARGRVVNQTSEFQCIMSAYTTRVTLSN
jgi:hypothetical protein